MVGGSFAFAALWVSVSVAAVAAWPSVYSAAAQLRRAWTVRLHARKDMASSEEAWQPAETAYQPM